MFESLQLLWIAPPGRGLSLLQGLVSTVQIAVGAYGLGLVLGLLGALGKLHGGRVLRFALTTYTTLIRAVPELVLILLLYYAGTDALNKALESFGYQPVDISGLVAGISGAGLCSGRLFNRSHSRCHASRAQRAKRSRPRLWHVAHKNTITYYYPRHDSLCLTPALSNLWLIALKDTALLAVVGFFRTGKRHQNCWCQHPPLPAILCGRRRALSDIDFTFQPLPALAGSAVPSWTGDGMIDNLHRIRTRTKTLILSGCVPAEPT